MLALHFLSTQCSIYPDLTDICEGQEPQHWSWNLRGCSRAPRSKRLGSVVQAALRTKIDSSCCSPASLCLRQISLESKKMTWTGPFACQRQLLSLTLQASCFFLAARWQPVKSEEEHSKEICLPAPHQPAWKGKQLFGVVAFHLWKIPENCFSLKYFPRKTQCPTKAKRVATSRARGKDCFVLWTATAVGKGCLLIFIFPLKLQLSCKLFNKEIRASR